MEYRTQGQVFIETDPNGNTYRVTIGPDTIGPVVRHDGQNSWGGLRHVTAHIGGAKLWLETGAIQAPDGGHLVVTFTSPGPEGPGGVTIANITTGV